MNFRNHAPVLSDEDYEEGLCDPMINPPDWKEMITAPLEMNCLAPSNEALGAAFDLYCDVLLAPFQARKADMAALYAEILGGIADLQILAPDLLDEVLSPDQEEQA